MFAIVSHSLNFEDQWSIISFINFYIIAYIIYRQWSHNYKYQELYWYEVKKYSKVWEPHITYLTGAFSNNS